LYGLTGVNRKCETANSFGRSGSTFNEWLILLIRRRKRGKLADALYKNSRSLRKLI